MRKYNQLVKSKAYKNDILELTELGQFLRDVFPTLSFKVEWFVLFDREGQFVRITDKGIPPGMKSRHPDIMILKNNKLVACLEVDGRIHDIHVADTMKRDEDYKTAGIPLIVINKQHMQTNMFDIAHREVSKYA